MKLNDITRKQFKEMEYFKPTKPFTDIIIVPTEEIHDSVFRCMKFVLWNAESGYLRIMTDHYLEVDDYSFSDFSFYVGRSIYDKT